MAPNFKRVCLTHHLLEGDTQTKAQYLRLSLGDDEINHYLYRRDGVLEVKEKFEISSENGQGCSCLAIIRLLFYSTTPYQRH